VVAVPGDDRRFVLSESPPSPGAARPFSVVEEGTPGAPSALPRVAPLDMGGRE
jgi:hypothetical protein